MKSDKLILLVNLGSPEELSLAAIRKFLRRFLCDRRVVGLPRLIWYPILFGIILPLRAKKLLHKYQQIWFENNISPLIYYTQSQVRLLQAKMEGDVYVDYAFSYSSPNIESVLAKDEYKNCREITVIPLYPQHSSSTTASVYDQISKFHEKRYFVPKLNFVNSFAGNNRYIQALADSVQAHWSQYGHAQKLIVSFHSIPLNLIEGGDIYLQECQLTYHLLCSKLNLDPERDAVLTFQSRFGRAKWLEPATAATIVLLARAEVKSLDVICPGFISDCLETLEEIAIQNRQLFIDNGGVQLNYISCLNDSDACIDVLYDLAFEKRD